MLGRATLGVGLLLLVVGCQIHNRSRHVGPASEGTEVVAIGDWADVDAALEVAVGQAELALVRETSMDGVDVMAGQLGPAWREFKLIGAGDEPGFVRLEPRPGEAPGEIYLKARIGRDGDAARERFFLGALKQRLGDLSQREWAPIRPAPTVR